jgi:hypothetical protein
MFVPLEVVDEISRYMRNRDLISMSLVCKHWHPTCTRHLSAQLEVDTLRSFHQKCLHYLDNFRGHGLYTRLPQRPEHIKSIKIKLDLNRAALTSTVLTFTALNPLLDHLGHVRHLKLHTRLTRDQMEMFETLCRDIHERLPNVKHLDLSCWWFSGKNDECLADEMEQTLFKWMMGSRPLTSLTLEYGYPFDQPAAILASQAPTLVNLDVSFPVLAITKGGSGLGSFPCLKKLRVRIIGDEDDANNFFDDPEEEQHVVDFGTAFPALEDLHMQTATLRMVERILAASCAWQVQAHT